VQSVGAFRESLFVFSLLADVITWPQNSLVALDGARIVRARSGFHRTRIVIKLTAANHCHALPVGGP
jgi:hypothetical protein